MTSLTGPLNPYKPPHSEHRFYCHVNLYVYLGKDIGAAQLTQKDSLKNQKPAPGQFSGPVFWRAYAKRPLRLLPAHFLTICQFLGVVVVTAFHLIFVVPCFKSASVAVWRRSGSQPFRIQNYPRGREFRCRRAVLGRFDRPATGRYQPGRTYRVSRTLRIRVKSLSHPGTGR